MRILCRQVAFMQNKNLNHPLTSQLRYDEMNELLDTIEEIMEARQKERNKMDERETLLRETITGLSHDIRTPLTSVKGYFNLLKDDQISGEERNRYVDIINYRIDSLENILEELFTYAKLRDKEYSFAITPVNMSKIVTDASFSFYDNFTQLGVEPVLNIEDDVFTKSNEEAAMRIVQNVIKNALTHGKDYFEISLVKDEGHVVFTCTNNTDETDINMDSVFTRFYRANNQKEGTGTGLGLAISKELAKLTGADIAALVDGDRFSIRVMYKCDDK